MHKTASWQWLEKVIGAAIPESHLLWRGHFLFLPILHGLVISSGFSAHLFSLKQSNPMHELLPCWATLPLLVIFTSLVSDQGRCRHMEMATLKSIWDDAADDNDKANESNSKKGCWQWCHWKKIKSWKSHPFHEIMWPVDHMWSFNKKIRLQIFPFEVDQMAV